MIPVSKYHGCGNDFILVCEYDVVKQDYAQLAIRLCDRHFGIGADGLIVVKQNPLMMLIYNCDGSRAPMCGNGLRCFANYVSDEGICELDQYIVQTLAGDQLVQVLSRNPFRVEVNMGRADDNPLLIHTLGNVEVKNYPLVVNEQTYLLNSFFMATIHTVVYVEHPFDEKWEAVGNVIHEHPLFQEKSNVNFVQVMNRQNISVQTYERGVGLTLACGTGCCAAMRESYRQGLCDDHVRVQLLRGSLDIRMDENECLYMSGSAQLIMKGESVI